MARESDLGDSDLGDLGYRRALAASLNNEQN